MNKFYSYLVCFFLASCNLIFASEKPYQYLSPVPGSTFNTLESAIIIREGSNIDLSSLSDGALTIIGSKSGPVAGDIILSKDNKTIIFKPYNNFLPNETVTVMINPKIRTTSGRVLPEYTFDFQIAPFTKTPNPYGYIKELRPDFNELNDITNFNKTSSDSTIFPPMHVDMYDSSALGNGYIFLAVASHYENVGFYLMMLNNDGTPFYSKELMDHYAYNFQVQPNGYLTYSQFIEEHSYTGGGDVIHIIMDKSFNVIDNVTAGNGYVAEAHDFQILPNGHYLLFGYYLTQVDMSQYVDGGQPNAYVAGGVVQELDVDKNVVFQWRSWDHYSFDSYPFGRRSTGSIVPAFHLNVISLDIDGNIILGTPSWVKKINRQTGEIIWNLGDFDNDFTFVGIDSATGLSYVGGHSFYRLDSGHFLNYDNGNRQGTISSTVHEYIIDEDKKTVEVVWNYIPDQIIAGWHRGNAQRLPNGNTVIGWGGSNGNPSPAFTEISSTGEKLMELFFDPPLIESYRAYRFPFTGGMPDMEAVIYELIAGNEYDFMDNDSVYTGVSIKVNSYGGSGYNEIDLKKYNYAPIEPGFFGKAPRVIPVRFTLSKYNITDIDFDLILDVDIFNITDPENTMIYQREFENSGLFLPLSTTYNPVTGKLTATSNNIGEFIFAVPDMESLIFTPIPQSPVDSGEVNQELPVKIQWNPVGYINAYSLQVATDENFNNLVVDETNMTDAYFIMPSVNDSTTYYWRVKSFNDAGESDWCSTQSFSTVAPFIAITFPNGGENLQKGLPVYIRWDDNIEEDVILSLLKNDLSLADLDTVESVVAFSWEVGLNLETGNDYKIKITSVVDNNLYSVSSSNFSIIDTVTSVNEDSSTPDDYQLFQNYPNPFNPSTSIQFSLPVSSFVTLKVYNILGKETLTILNEEKPAGNYEVELNASNLTSGVYFYRLQADTFVETKKMVLLR